MKAVGYLAIIFKNNYFIIKKVNNNTKYNDYYQIDYFKCNCFFVNKCLNKTNILFFFPNQSEKKIYHAKKVILNC